MVALGYKGAKISLKEDDVLNDVIIAVVVDYVDATNP